MGNHERPSNREQAEGLTTQLELALAHRLADVSETLVQATWNEDFHAVNLKIRTLELTTDGVNRYRITSRHNLDADALGYLIEDISERPGEIIEGTAIITGMSASPVLTIDRFGEAPAPELMHDKDLNHGYIEVNSQETYRKLIEIIDTGTLAPEVENRTVTEQVKSRKKTLLSKLAIRKS